MSVIILHIAAVAWLVARPSVAALIVIGVTVAIAGLLRPASYFLFALLVAVPFLVRQQRLRSTLIPIGSAALIFGTGALSSYAARGVATQTIGGMAMYGHVAHLFDPAQSTLSDAIKAKAVELRDELVKKRGNAHSIVERQGIEMNGFNDTNHQIAPLLPVGQVNTLFAQLSRESVRSNPVGYIETVAENVYAAYAKMSLANFGVGGSELLESNFGHEIDHNWATGMLAWFYKIPSTFERRWFLYAFAFSLIFFATRISNPLSLIGIYSGVLHFAGITFASAATVFIPRYAVTLDAMVLVAVACGVGLLAGSFGKQADRENSMSMQTLN
jgi:hypothetical protein